MGVYRQQHEFIKGMAQVDKATPPDTSISNVLAMLGRPYSTRTNDNRLYVEFVFAPSPFWDSKIMTNGFLFVFSNGVVVEKSPSLSLR